MLWPDVKSCDFRSFAGILSIALELRSRVLLDKTDPHRPLQLQAPLYGAPIHGSRKAKGFRPAAAHRAPRAAWAESRIGKSSVDVIVIEHIERPTPN